MRRFWMAGAVRSAVASNSNIADRPPLGVAVHGEIFWANWGQNQSASGRQPPTKCSALEGDRDQRPVFQN